MRLVLGTTLLLCVASAPARGDVLENGRRPLMWRVTSRTPLPAATVTAIGNKFGASLTSVENAIVDAGGIQLQVNNVVCATDADAQTLYPAFIKLKGDPVLVMRRGAIVVEFLCNNRLVVQKARDWIGWDTPKTVTWKVGMTVAPLAHAPPMEWNRLFNALSAWRQQPNDATEARARKRARGFMFRDIAAFRAEDNPWGKPAYVFDRKFADRDTWQFEKLPRRLGIPYLNVSATIPVRPFATRGGNTKPDRKRLCAATPFWPVDHLDIKNLLPMIIPRGKKLTPRGHVEWLLRWVQNHVRYDGKITGSRYGVRQVLRQSFGHCWDKSDVFITLCRAAGIPARQIGGWVHGMSGHIWCDVWIHGEGWVEVDATASWLGTSEEYVPFWISEDGRSPFVYWEQPTMTRAG